VITPPDEEAGKIEAMVRVEVRKEDADRPWVGMPLQGTKHSAAEVDHQRWCIGCGHQIARGWRIWPDDAAGTSEYGDSHAH
jgi:hypothetical protein